MEDLNEYVEPRPRVDPVDQYEYFISGAVVEFTHEILLSYHKQEGVVYWAGTQADDKYFITAAVAPRIHSRRYNFKVDHDANAAFVGTICEHRLTYISQVHSHPADWVDHSDVDDTETAFRSEGLVSIVVPDYCKMGMLPIEICGVHRFDARGFDRLSDNYVRGHFKIDRSLKPVLLKDLRYE